MFSLMCRHPGATPTMELALPFRTLEAALHGAAFLLPTKGITRLTLHLPHGRIALDPDKLETLMATLAEAEPAGVAPEGV